MEVNRMEETKQILIAITELQTNMRNMSAKIDEISNISRLASETEQSAKSAHNRINDLKADFSDKLQAQKEDYEEKLKVQEKQFDKLEGNITWLWRTVGGAAITFVFGIILYFVQKGGI